MSRDPFKHRVEAKAFLFRASEDGEAVELVISGGNVDMTCRISIEAAAFHAAGLSDLVSRALHRAG